jgi:hypothetical protein
MLHAAPRVPSASSTSLPHVHLGFFDRHLHLAADDRADLAAIAALYRRFQEHADGSPALPSASDSTAVVLTRLANLPGPALLRVGDHLGTLRIGDGFPPSLVFEWSIASVLAQVQSHVLFHAGAVSAQGQGILLVGDSGQGKTTLVLALLRRGFRFLSDDVGAIARATGQLVPFPRSLLLRPGTLARTGFTLVQDPPWLGEKQFVDVAEIMPNALGEPVPLRHIVFLHNPASGAGPSALVAAAGHDHLDLWLSRVDQAILHEIVRCAAPAHVAVQPDAPVVRLNPAPHAAVLDRIERICESHGVFLLDIVKRAPQCPKFDAAVMLEKLDRGAGLLHLLPHFLGTHRSPLVGPQADVVGFVTLLGRLIGAATCFRLTVGNLHEMVDAVAGLVEEP